MSGWRGFLTGALGLVALYVIVQPSAAGRLGEGATGLGTLAQRFLDPSVPAFGAIKKTSTTAAPSFVTV